MGPLIASMGGLGALGGLSNQAGALNQYQALQGQQLVSNAGSLASWSVGPIVVGSKKSMVREYLNRHKDIIFTLTMAILVDHFVLGGALRKRIQNVIEAALSKIESSLGVGNEK